MRTFFILIIFSLPKMLSFGQTGAANSESLLNVSDSTLRNEIAHFAVTGGSLRKNNPAQSQLMEIPVRHCSDREVALWYSTFLSSVSIFIHIYFKGDLPDTTIDSISLVTHSHFLVRIPKDAYKGIVVSNPCTFSKSEKQEKSSSPFFKAFYSQDKRRLYIYMQCEIGRDKSEVTWIFKNDKYLKRIEDHIP